MGVFLALGSIAFAFGDTILPEIQVSLAFMHGTCTATTNFAMTSPITSCRFVSSYIVLGHVILAYVALQLWQPCCHVTAIHNAVNIGRGKSLQMHLLGAVLLDHAALTD